MVKFMANFFIHNSLKKIHSFYKGKSFNSCDIYLYSRCWCRTIEARAQDNSAHKPKQNINININIKKTLK